MLKLFRAIADFVAGCIEALQDDDAVAATSTTQYEARRQRWLEYLKG
jgi:hypothetical protein